MEANEKLSLIATELFIRVRKLDISVNHNLISKYLNANATHYFTTKISNKRELQQIALSHSSDIEFYMKLYKYYTIEPFLFLVNNTTLSSDNSLKFWKNLL